MKNCNLTLFGLLALMVSVPPSVFGAVIITNPLGPNCTDLSCPLQVFLRFMFIVVVPVSIIAIVIGAFQFLTAAGDVEKVKKAKKTVTYAVIGLFIVLISTSVDLVVKSLLN